MAVAEPPGEVVDTIVDGMGMVRTGFDAGATCDATRRGVSYLGAQVAPLRIVAPETAKRASLQEDRRADPGSVMDGKTLDVKDEAGGSHPQFIG